MGTITDKLVYLNDTKEKLKNVINYSDANLNNENTFREYPEKLYNQYNDILSNGIDTLFDNMPKRTDIGGAAAAFSVDGTVNSLMKMELEPDTYQYITNGNQLINFNNYSYKNDSVTYSFSNNILTASNTSETYPHVEWDITTLVKNNPGKVLNFGYNKISNITGSGTIAQLRIESGTTQYFALLYRNLTKVSYTIASDTSSITTVKFGIYPNNSSTAATGSVTIEKPLLYFGNNSTYEPYTGAAAAPNPDYPQDVYVISGDNEIKVENKNLLNVNNFELIDLTNSKTRVGYLFNLKAGTYTLSNLDFGSSGQDRLYVNTKYIGESVFTERGSSVTLQNITMTNDGQLALTIASSQLPTSLLTKGMLEKGSTSTTYVPHQEQTASLNLPVENLFDKDSANIIDNLDVAATNNSYGNNNNFATIYLKLPIGTYTISRGDTSTISIASSSNIPANGGTHQVRANGSNSAYTYTTQYEYLAIGIDKRSVSINDFIEGLQIEYGSKPNTYTPYGTPSIEYCKIGNYKDEFKKSTGKNLLDIDNMTFKQGYIDNDGTFISANNNGTIEYINVLPNTTYTLGIISNIAGGSIVEYNNNTFLQRNSITSNTSSKTITTSATTNKLAIFFNLDNSTQVTFDVMKNLYPQLEEGLTATEYEPYGTNQWYLKKNIGKVVLDGSEAYVYSNPSQTAPYGYYYRNLSASSMNGKAQTSNIKCNYFLYNSNLNDNTMTTGNWGFLQFVMSSINSVEDFKIWVSNHNLIIYYELATPTYTLLNDTLQTQLETIYNKLLSYQEQTNISQINNDQAFLINPKIIKNYEATINE